MYINIGGTVIPGSGIIGIFDLDNTTVSVKTREFLQRAEKENRIEYTGSEIPVSFILCRENDGREKIYLSPVSAKILKKRFETPDL